MKIKYQLAVICAALAMTNCSQEDGMTNSNQGGAHTLQAIIESGSRSSVTDGGAFSWTTDDNLSVWVGDRYEIYTYSGTNNIFSGSSNTISGYAIYPSGDHPNVTEGALPIVNLKKEYDHGSTNAIMLAEIQTGSDKLTFKHLGGLMRFCVKNVPAEEGSFTFTANTGITGNFQIEEEESIKVIRSVSGTEENQTVTINYEAGDAGRTLTFYVPLPLGTYTGFTIVLGEKEYKTTAVNTIQRGTLLLMPTYKYDESGLTKEDGHTIVLEDNENAEVTISSGKVMIDATEASDATVTLKYTPEDNTTATLSLSDGSAENASSSNESKATVNVTVPGNTTVASLDIDMPTMTVELNAESGNATYEKVIAKTAAQTLIVKKGITISELTIEGGNVILENGSIVTKIKRSDDNTEVTYIIYETATVPEIDSDEDIVLVSAGEWNLKKAIKDEKTSSYQLKEDIVLIEPLTIPSGKTFSLNLNGKTISQEKVCTASYGMITNKGTLTIDDSSEDKSGKISFKDTSAGDPKYGWGSYTLVNYGTLIVEEGTIENLSQQNTPGNVVHMYCAIQSTGTTTIKGGKVSTPTYRSVRPNKGSLIIEGGTFVGQVWLQPNQGDVTLKISGGSFEPTGGDGSSVFMTNTGENYTVSSASITGGMFNTKIGCTTPDKEGVKGCITGGTFTETAKNGTKEALLADSYGFLLSGENYIVSKTE